MLTVEAHEVLQPRFPVIDAPNHLGDAFLTWTDDWLSRPVSQLIATMDEAGVHAIVDLDGRWGDLLRAELARYNERWEELHENPDWHFYPTRPKGDLSHPDFPSFDEVIEQFETLLRRHPRTDFVGAHVGCYAENLGWVGRVMDACPNFYADIGARIAELGRQPF